jgi:hypothetical protein
MGSLLKLAKKIAKKINKPMTVGFSDDDINYVISIKKYFNELKSKSDGIEYYIYDTSEKGIKKIAI